MNNKKFLKKPEIIIIVIIIGIVDKSIKNILIVYNDIPISNLSNLYFSLFLSFVLILFIKHRFWTFACGSLVINDLCNIYVQKALRTSELPKTDIFLILMIILGTFFLVVSSFYVYKFLKIKNYEKFFLIRWKKNSSKRRWKNGGHKGNH